MASVASLLDRARTFGLVVRVENDLLVVRGPRRYEHIARQLFANKPGVMALLAAEEAGVSWRVAAMRAQIPELGPIPFLVARADPIQPGACLSCGAPLPGHRTIRCPMCAVAARMVVGLMCEGTTA